MTKDLTAKVNLSTTMTLCANKVYNSDTLRAHIKQASCYNRIPSKQNAKFTNNYMKRYLQKAYNLVENNSAKLKNYRVTAIKLNKLNKLNKLKQNYYSTRLRLFLVGIMNVQHALLLT